VAVERSSGRCHFDRAGGRAGWYLRFQISISHHLELRCHSVERHAGRPREIVSKNVHNLADFAEVDLRLNEWTEAHREGVERATRLAAGAPGIPAEVRASIKDSIGRLEKAGFRKCTIRTDALLHITEVVEHVQRTLSRELVECATRAAKPAARTIVINGSTNRRRAIEISVGALDDPANRI